MDKQPWTILGVARTIIIAISILAFIFVVTRSSKSPGATQEKLMVLTFDDGPKRGVLLGLDTNNHKPIGRPGLLKVLEYANVPAHFFVIGFKAREQKDLVRTMATKGFFFENHTYGHETLKNLERKNGFGGIKADLEKADKLLTELTGRKPKYFRPPMWQITAEQEKFIRDELGYTVMKLGRPDLNGLDYDFYEKKRSATELVDYIKGRIASHERSGIFANVLVFHELTTTTLALEELIPYFQKFGYRFVSLDEYFASTHKEVAR